MSFRFLIAASVLALVACTQSATKTNRGDHDLIVKVRVQPSWPHDALVGGVNGVVKLRGTVNTEGMVENVTVVSSDPPGVFDAAAIDAFSHWRFLPRIKDGKPVAREAEQSFNFQLDEAKRAKRIAAEQHDDAIPIVRVEPKFPQDALRAGISGWVKIAGTVLPDGSVTDLKVVDSDVLGKYNKAALRAVARWKFKPKFVDGVAVARPFEQTIQFNIDPQPPKPPATDPKR